MSDGQQFMKSMEDAKKRRKIRAERFRNMEYQENKWIKCSEKTPPLGEEVLVYTSSDTLELAWHDPDFPPYMFRDGWLDKVTGVTHWMPLPNPPEAEEK
jgi:hypothetical protein